MALSGYGYLIGNVTSYRPQRGGSPHALLMVQPANPTHPPYRIAVNLESTQPGYPPGIQYQIVEIGTNGTQAAKDLAAGLSEQGATSSFVLAADDPAAPRLDFVRGGIIDPNAFQTVAVGQSPFRSAFEQALEADVGTGATGDVLIAVFGTGYPINDQTGKMVATGFTGVDNIHMNQGAMHYVNGDDHYKENGPNQDGGLILLRKSGAIGFFVKFQSQTIATDANGNPAITGIERLDTTPAPIRQAIFATKATAPAPASQAAAQTAPLAAAKTTQHAPTKPTAHAPTEPTAHAPTEPTAHAPTEPAAPTAPPKGAQAAAATGHPSATAKGHPAAAGGPDPKAVQAPARASDQPAIPAGDHIVTTTAPQGDHGGPAYVFADTNPLDNTEKFVVEDDSGTYTTPFVMSFSTGHTRGPVPTPRGYPTMNLTDVVGANPPGFVSGPDGQSIVFDMVGDSGATTQGKLTGELGVTDLMSRNALQVKPAFLFHLGDIVYFYGEQDYYYSQFAEPFRAYPAPIFAIPGNHDGVTYNANMTSLDAFQKAFCAAVPGRWEGFGGILRSTMTQPGVYFTLDAPLVSIIGLYSNCGESDAWLDEQQLLFLFHELTRLKALRASEGRAVILAIHHCPRWFPGESRTDPTSAAIDRACQQADFWPDAVTCGHAHLMQRVVRQINGRDIPYLIVGAGGYGINTMQELAKKYMQTLTANGTRLGCFIPEEGYARVTVTKPANGAAPTLRFEYLSVKRTDGRPADVCVVDLSKNTLV